MVTLAELTNVSTLTDLDRGAAFEHLGLLVDLAGDHQDESAALKAIELGVELQETPLASDDAILLHYFVGNAWSILKRIRRARAQDAAWAWEQPEAREEILSYRRACSHPRFLTAPPIRRCQVLTNLGNLMSNVGRFVEALEYYDAALEIDPKFGMALGNRGDCLLYYARSLYDDGHVNVFARHVVDLIDAAVEAGGLEPGVGELLLRQREIASGRAGRSASEFDSGPDESAPFQRWALDMRLYINPLNDLGPHPVANRDVLHLPTMTVAADIGSGFHGFFNQLLQEFATARYLLFEGLAPSRGKHEADEPLLLLETWNDTVNSMAIEKVKLALRSAYSLLDKVGVFVARYFQLSHPLHRVNMRSVWYVGCQQHQGLLAEFDGRRNWPLRGLFWISKDLFTQDDEYQEAIQPDARAVATLRNKLEHQYARVVETQRIRRPDEPDVIPPDPFGYEVTRDDLEAKAKRVMRMARAALIYLSLAVHQEERGRAESSGPGVYRGSFPIR